MRASLLIVGLILILAVTATYAVAEGCGMPNMSCGSGAGAAGAKTPAADLPPVENQLQIVGTVVSVEANGAALVDIGTGKVYVVARQTPDADGTVPPSPFKVGDRVQVAGILLALSVEPAAAANAPAPAALKQVRFHVDNILCGMCSTSVQKALQATPGVQQVSVTVQGTASVGYDPAKTSTEALAKVIAGAKHPHQGMTFKATLLQ